MVLRRWSVLGTWKRELTVVGSEFIHPNPFPFLIASYRDSLCCSEESPIIYFKINLRKQSYPWSEQLSQQISVGSQGFSFIHVGPCYNWKGNLEVASSFISVLKNNTVRNIQENGTLSFVYIISYISYHICIYHIIYIFRIDSVLEKWTWMAFLLRKKLLKNSTLLWIWMLTAKCLKNSNLFKAKLQWRVLFYFPEEQKLLISRRTRESSQSRRAFLRQ